MNRESIKNRRIIALVIVIALLVLSFGSDMVSRRESKLKSEENFIKSQISSFTDKSLKEKILMGTNENEKIMVLNIEGVIAGSQGYMRGGGYNHDEILKSIEDAKEDTKIKGIILKVNSPGGTVYHSAELWDRIMELKEIRKDIKIYTSMGTVAASGGYYVAAPSDKIFAAEETVTGSIGVIADYVNYTGLEEKLGIKHNVIKSADHKDIGSPSREMTDDEKYILKNTVMDSYEKFLDVVSQGRHISKDKLRPIADGRTYSGVQAKANGLVDEIGYFKDAIQAMTEELELKDPIVFEKTPITTDYFSNIFGLKLDSLIEKTEIDTIKDLRSIYGVNNSPNILYMLGGY